MSDFDDLERLRLAPEPRANRPRTSAGPAAFVGRVTTAEPEVGKFLLVRPVRIFGAAEPGSAAEPEDMGEASVPAYLVGPGTPATGDRLIVRHVPDRWAAGFRETGQLPGDIVRPLGCPCASTTGLPGLLNMSVTYGPGKTAADYDYQFLSTELTYQPPPSYASDTLGTFWYSPLIPIPELAATLGPGYSVWYRISCNETGFELGQGNYPTDFMLPFHVANLFADSCSPFLINVSGPAPGDFSTLGHLMNDGGSIVIS